DGTDHHRADDDRADHHPFGHRRGGELTECDLPGLWFRQVSYRQLRHIPFPCAGAGAGQAAVRID
ncbi:MAG: hypothetical protein ACRD0P_39995, partial [Stackebrandtia sp.]